MKRQLWTPGPGPEAGTRFPGRQRPERNRALEARVLREAGAEVEQWKGTPDCPTRSDTLSLVSSGAPIKRRGRAGPDAGTGAQLGRRKHGGQNTAAAGSILRNTRPGRAGSRPALRPLGLARTFAPRGGLAVQARVDGVGFPALTPVRKPHSLALTYPSWPSGWCPAAPTLCPAAASGHSAGRTALPGRWAVHRNRGAPRAPVAPCRPLLRD